MKNWIEKIPKENELKKRDKIAQDNMRYLLECNDKWLKAVAYSGFQKGGSTPRFYFPNSSITASECSVMIEIGKKIGGGSRAAAPRADGQGYFPPQWGLPRKFFTFLPENGAFWLHFFAIREIFSQFKGGEAMAQVAQW